MPKVKAKKEKWLCPLCLGYDHPPSQEKMERFEAMERLYQAFDDLFSIMFWERFPDDGDGL